MNTCRVCNKQEFERNVLFKYGTRHYAHGTCGIIRFGAQFLDMIPQYEIGRLPYFALEDHKLLKEAERRIKEQAAS